jgi:putative oxidoreductase
MGIILIAAGYAKFAGGIEGFAGFMGQAGFPAPGLLAPLLATWEIIGGLLILIGLGGRWLGLLVILEFLVAAFVVKLPRLGWDASRIDLMMLAGGLLLLLASTGKAPADEMLARRRAGTAPAREGAG